MMNILKNKYLGFQAAFMVGLLTNLDGAQAAGGNNFSDIARNINDSVAELPGLITSISYLFGMLMGVLGVLKIKDHVENPTNTPLKDGAVRLGAGGALFALPILFESMYNTIGETTNFVSAAELNPAEFNVR